MITPSRLAIVAALLLLAMSGCAGPRKLARMDPALPIATAGGYSQHGQPLDGAHMVKQLEREPAAKPHVKRARALGIMANVLAATGGALIGWPIGQWGAGAAEPNWNLAYAGAGALAAGIGLAVWSVASMRSAVDAHNRITLSEEPALASKKPPPELVRQGSLMFVENDLSGIRLTWLGMLGSPEPRLALRFQRAVKSAEPELCRQLEVVVDGRPLHQVESTYKADAQRDQVRETVQAEFELASLRSIAASPHTVFKVCGRSRRLTADAAASGVRFLDSYLALAKQAAEDAARAEALSASDSNTAAREQPPLPQGPALAEPAREAAGP
jgi:hypothetical protein